MFKMLTGRLLNPNYISVKNNASFETPTDHIHPSMFSRHCFSPQGVTHQQYIQLVSLSMKSVKFCLQQWGFT